MTRTMVQEMEVPIRIVRLPPCKLARGSGGARSTCGWTRGALPPAGLAGLARRGLDRGGGGRVDPRADRGKPGHGECRPLTLKEITNRR